jgi:exonuclease SbcC
MFEIEYQYQRGGPLYQKKYTSPSNIFVVEGPNDTGKSTLLQMIALGLYGDKIGEIDDSLKQKMFRLLDPKTEKCEFKFSIKSSDGRILTSELKNGQIEIKIDNKTKPLDYIKENFQIIFDIPGEPMGKLISALRTIKEEILTYERYIGTYLSELTRLKEKIEDWKSKEQKISELEGNIKDLENQKEGFERRLKIVKNNFEELEKAKIVNRYEDLSGKINSLETELNKINKQLLQAKRAMGKTRKSQRILNELSSTLLSLKVLSPLDTVKSLLDNSKRAELNKIEEELERTRRNDLTKEKVSKWISSLTEIRRYIAQIDGEKNLRIEKEILEFLSKLRTLLRDFMHLHLYLGGKRIEVSQLLTEIESYYKEIESKSQVSKLEKASEELENKLKLLEKTKELLEKIPELPEEDYESLKESKEKLTKEREKLVEELIKLHPKYVEITEEQKIELRKISDWETELNQAEKELKWLDNKIKEIQNQIITKNATLDALKDTKKPSIKISEEDLNHRFNICQRIQRKIEKFRELMENTNLEVKPEKLSEDEKRYYDILGEYFAEILEEIYFEHKSWKLKKLDLLEKCYVVEGREKPIFFVDLGTGHSKLGAFMAKLKHDTEKKKIVLLDEVGDMDKDVFGKLLDEIRLQVKAGKILLAALTKVRDDVKEPILTPIQVEEG